MAKVRTAAKALAVEYATAHEMPAARVRVGLTQKALAEAMDTTKSAISSLESAGRHAPSRATIERCVSTVGCEPLVRVPPQK